ncbi:MAG: Sec23/Sec24 zinc finger-containing protein [Bacilli bacterium]|nr:Sec23/Sec24 zinc finger-containing protein [Bacilli bacterium]
MDWYCDECGDFLNNQCGFNTYSRKWKCKNCGFINSITEDDIQ